MPRILIVTGEASGDLHGANLAIALQRLQPDIRLVGIGGAKMQEAGIELIPGIERLDVVGILGPMQAYKGLKNLSRLSRFLRQEQFDAVVFIDNPGMNLRLARMAAKVGHRIIYYIAPQIWAWGARRIKLISRVVHRMIVILPFEEPLYRKAGVPCDFVGHPLLDTMAPSYDRGSLREQFGLQHHGPVLGLLPGSRESEVRLLLPTMINAARQIAQCYPGLQCLIAQAQSIGDDLIEKALQGTQLDVKAIHNQTTEIMAASDLLFVASGTATLQAALVGTPMVIAYRASWLTHQLFKLVIRVKFIGLVNLIAGRDVVPELIQHQATAERLSEEGLRLLTDRIRHEEMRQALQGIRDALGTPGASVRAAKLVLAECQS